MVSSSSGRATDLQATEAITYIDVLRRRRGVRIAGQRESLTPVVQKSHYSLVSGA